MVIKKPQLVKVEAFAIFLKGEFCNTLDLLVAPDTAAQSA